ncbi:MAG: hemolysin III family protein [Planctomycetes bacterium]|nr:hemolysin III family protein [Planctomycetota bacterium]
MEIGDLTPFLAFLREPFSGLTHLGAALASVQGLRVLRRRGEGTRGAPRRASLLFFGWSLIALFGASALYHLAALPPAGLEWTRRIDHAAIFLLIIGTYTAVCLNVLAGAWRAWVLGVVWTLGLAGMVEKLGFAYLPEALSTSLYVALGWVGLMVYPSLARIFGHRRLLWILGGGLAYTGGAIVDLLRWPAVPWGVLGHHEIFHLTAIAGAFLHFGFVVRYVAPGSRPASPRGQRGS